MEMEETRATQAYDVSEEEIPEIHRAESRLAESVGALIMELDELGQRLGRVLRPEDSVDPSTDQEKLSAVRPATTPFTDFLTAQANRIDLEAARVREILRRLGL